MKLTVTQENLSRALATVSRIASTRGSLPILSNVLLKTDNNQLLIEVKIAFRVLFYMSRQQGTVQHFL